MPYNNKKRESATVATPDALKRIDGWIQTDFEDETIAFTDEFAKELVDNRLTTSQIRIIFSEVKRIASRVSLPEGSLVGNKKDFLMLRPKMAYAAKRAGTHGTKSLQEVLERAHIAVTDKMKEDQIKESEVDRVFFNFVDFFESILAYHKVHGGRD